jgi:lysyl-tRNA synthetase, class II
MRATSAAASGSDGPVSLVARCIGGEGGTLLLTDQGRVREVVLASASSPSPGAWVRVTGRRDGGRIVDASLELVQPARIAPDRWPQLEAPEALCLRSPARLEAIRQRSRLISFIRSFLDQRDFLEVQTPFLHAQAEACHVQQLWTTGASGRRLYLRTDPEEYLKRYLTAGFDSVYEVSTNVRGEQVDKTHLQEFTSVEGYRRCWRFNEVLAFVQELTRACLVAIGGEPIARFEGISHDLGAPIAVCSFDDLVAEHSGLRPSSYPTPNGLAEVVSARFGWRGTGTAVDRFRRTWLEWLFDRKAVPAIRAPMFVVDFPVELGLSGRERDDAAGTCHRGELYLPGGFELAHFYENLTEPDPLRARYAARLDHRIAAGLEPVPLDAELMLSSELGMPPMGGFAVGVDRLLMVALGEGDVATGLLFPREGFAPSPRGVS